MSHENIVSFSRFDQANKTIRARVIESAKKREAFAWEAIKADLGPMTSEESKHYRESMLGYFVTAAVRIFNNRAENPEDWTTWIQYLGLVMAENGVIQ